MCDSAPSPTRCCSVSLVDFYRVRTFSAVSVCFSPAIRTDVWPFPVEREEESWVSFHFFVAPSFLRAQALRNLHPCEANTTRFVNSYRQSHRHIYILMQLEVFKSVK